MNYFVTVDMAMKAVKIVRPLIEEAMNSHLVKRHDLCIVVLDPAVTPVDSPIGVILYKFTFGDPSKWEHDYERIAYRKAQVSWRFGQSSLVVQQTMPHLYREGDTVHAGSVNHLGIVVACSGVESYFDNMFSMMVAVAIQALSIQAYKNLVEKNPDMNFFGEEKKE